MLLKKRRLKTLSNTNLKSVHGGLTSTGAEPTITKAFNSPFRKQVIILAKVESQFVVGGNGHGIKPPLAN